MWMAIIRQYPEISGKKRIPSIHRWASINSAPRIRPKSRRFCQSPPATNEQAVDYTPGQRFLFLLGSPPVEAGIPVAPRLTRRAGRPRGVPPQAVSARCRPARTARARTGGRGRRPGAAAPGRGSRGRSTGRTARGEWRRWWSRRRMQNVEYGLSGTNVGLPPSMPTGAVPTSRANRSAVLRTVQGHVTKRTRPGAEEGPAVRCEPGPRRRGGRGGRGRRGPKSGPGSPGRRGRSGAPRGGGRDGRRARRRPAGRRDACRA